MGFRRGYWVGLPRGEPIFINHAEYRIPRRRNERDSHGGEPMQSVLGFGFEEHSQSLTSILKGREDFIGFQFHVRPLEGQANFARWPA